MLGLGGFAPNDHAAPQGFLNTYQGGKSVHGEQAFSMFGGGSRAYQDKRWMDNQVAYPGGTPGIGFMAMTDEAGKVIVGQAAKRAKITHEGRDYTPNPKTGTLRYVQTATYLPAIRKYQEHQQRLNQLASFCAGGDTVSNAVFGEGFLEACKSSGSKATQQSPNGHVITGELANEDCTPSLTFQLPGDSKEFALKFAKLKQVVDAFGIIPLGELPSYDEPATGGDAGDVVGIMNGRTVQGADDQGTATYSQWKDTTAEMIKHF